MKNPWMFWTEARRGRALIVGALSLAVTACGGTINFKDRSDIVIAGKGPAEPKPPEPKPEPKPKKKRVVVKATKIEIDEKIQFDKGAATILPASHDLLNEIVSVLKDNAQIEKVAIEGHTSAEGSADLNRKLSEDRAKAVLDYLVEHGIDAKRLESKGYGPDKPIAGNDTEDDREKNRRVEFNILKQKSK
jgi:outer membrane protein OmpA-like peptidoglycan-associated protein